MIAVIANSQISFESMGGSDKIFIELAKSWSKSKHAVKIWGCSEAGKMCAQAGFKKNFARVTNFDVDKFGLFWAYLLRTLSGIFWMKKSKADIFYSSSDFWPDLFFGLNQKIGNKRIKWVAGLYLIAPNPLKSKYSNNLRGWMYFVSQRISIFLMKLWADLVLVLAQDDKEKLIELGISSDKVLVISGGVDYDLIDSIPKQKIKYEGVFLGRFHPQKGLDKLIDSWKVVIGSKPTVKLAIIGWGNEEWVSRVKKMISKANLNKNVKLLGFLDNKEKYKVLKSSRVFVFSSLYESWGIVVAEALACGLPVVAFDMPVTRKFGKEVTLVEYGNTKLMGQAIINLSNKKNKSKKMIKTYSWDDSANKILAKVL